MTSKGLLLVLLLACVLAAATTGCMQSATPASSEEIKTITITDAMGRQVEVPSEPDHVICSGPGCLRYLTYLQCEDRIVGVDSIEKRETIFDARPYAIANPQFKSEQYGLIGEFRGFDDPEKILALEPQPQVIFKTYGTMGYNPQELQERTGIPVVVLEYGDLATYRNDMYTSLRTMGEVMGKEERTEEVIAFFDAAIADLDERTSSVPDDEKTTCYVGGIAYKGPHGFQSTEPTYPPFVFTNAKNVAYDPNKSISHCDVAKEKILEWDPEVLFVDLSTLQSGGAAGGLYELRNDEAYQQLTAVKESRVYGVLPYNWYTQNHGSTLADAYFVGTLLYPEQFEDVNLKDKVIEIYTFLVGEGDPQLGKEVYESMDNAFDLLAFKKLEV